MTDPLPVRYVSLFIDGLELEERLKAICKEMNSVWIEMTHQERILVEEALKETAAQLKAIIPCDPSVS